MPQQLRGDRDVVGAVPERDVEAAPACAQRASASEREARPSALGREPAAAVAADRLVRDPEALEQAERLREVARGDEHLRRARSSARMTGRMTSTWGEFVRSIQTRKGK